MLTPSLQLDPTFGGSTRPLRTAVSLLPQRARSAHRRHRIRIRLKASALGLARVEIAHGGRMLADGLLPIFTTSTRTLPVEVTRYGDTYLRSHSGVRVTITATARDLVTSTRTATARGRLRY